MSILSATTFQVLEYDSTITVPSGATLGSTFYVGIDLLNASSGTYIYGAVLVHESAYRAEMQLKFDGTRAGTNLTQNGADIIQGYEIAGIGLSSVNKTTVQNIITDGIGSNNGSVTYKTTTTNSTSIPLVTSELRAGNYILLTGVYKSGEMLVAFNQCEILISTDRSSSSSGSSSASTEPYETVALKDVVSLYVNIGDNIKYDFKEDENPIGFVSFDAKTNVGYVTTTIEVLNDISTLVSAPPTGEVYKNINIWIGRSGYATEENIVNPVIGFKVAKLWISENDIDESTIKLNRYNSDKWNPLPTTKTGEDVNYIYFSSETSGFSPFAITGQKKIHVAPTPAVLPEEPAEAITPAPEVEVPPEPTPWWKYLLTGAVILLIIAGAYLYLRKQQS